MKTYPPTFTDAAIDKKLEKGSLAATELRFTYIYGILVRELTAGKWQVGSQMDLSREEAVKAVQVWLACARESVPDDDPRVKGT